MPPVAPPSASHSITPATGASIDLDVEGAEYKGITEPAENIIIC